MDGILDIATQLKKQPDLLKASHQLLHEALPTWHKACNKIVCSLKTAVQEKKSIYSHLSGRFVGIFFSDLVGDVIQLEGIISAFEGQMLKWHRLDVKIQSRYVVDDDDEC